MIGAIIGDIAGSRFKYRNITTKNFELFAPRCHITDDSILTLATASILMKCNHDYTNLNDITINTFIEIGRNYPNCGYGEMFFRWMFDKKQKPYRSYSNGSAMRISPIAYVAKDEK